MDPASGSLLLFWTIARAAGILVLATEAVLLLFRMRDEQREALAGRAVPERGGSRLVWAATPAVLLAGLAAWCLLSLPPRPAAGAAVLQASASSPR